MSSSTEAFTPRWASAPGATLSDVMEERQLRPEQLAKVMGIETHTIRGILAGETPITVGLARTLAKHVGSTVEFWLARDAQYREDARRLESDKWAASLPVRQMASLGWMTAPTNWKERIAACLRFFDVRDHLEWQQRSQPILQSAHFRRSPVPARESAILAWLRQGEIVTIDQSCAPWNPDAFLATLQDARTLTREMDPRKFIPALTALCAGAGVRFAVLRTPDGCPVSGVARFVDRERPTIVLSARYLADDHFWFSFFHEAAHLLLHGPGELYVDDDAEFKGGPTVSPTETEANRFAAQTLIPDGVGAYALRRNRSARILVAAAREIGVSPGILVGQMQHEGVIGFGAFNELKRRYKWVDVNLERT